MFVPSSPDPPQAGFEIGAAGSLFISSTSSQFFAGDADGYAG